jgi:hypothetical protein
MLPLVLWIALISLAGEAVAQTDGVLQINDDIHAFLRQQQVRGNLPDAHLEHLPLSAGEAREHLEAIEERTSTLTSFERRELAHHLHGFESGPVAALQGLIPSAYRNGVDLFSIEDEAYGVQINPLLYAEYGPVIRSDIRFSDEEDTAWRYARGARLSGHIGRYVFFETRLTENRTKPVEFDLAGGTAPRLGFVNTSDGVSYDHFEAEGIVGVRTPHFEARFGRDRHVWGPARGSLLLSDYASPYDHLQLRATLGPFQYTTLFAGLSERRYRRGGSDSLVPRKYAAFHRLSVAVHERITLSVAEAVVFETDTLGARSGFDLSYLNPIIFYRAVERHRGSPDNVVISAAAAWRPVDGAEVYGSLLLDEMVVSRIGEGWWGNKWGWVLGAFAAPADRLALRVELARLRPFLYSHRAPGTDYIHYNDLLGHLAGPNSVDLALFADVRLTPRLTGVLYAAHTWHGRNPPGENFGGDPLEPYGTRTRSDDIAIMEGILEKTLLLEGQAGYELMPGLVVRAVLRATSRTDEVLGTRRWLHPAAAISWGVPPVFTRY